MCCNKRRSPRRRLVFSGTAEEEAGYSALAAKVWRISACLACRLDVSALAEELYEFYVIREQFHTKICFV